MHCDEVRARLLDQLDHPDGFAAGAEDLDVHLEGCGECRVLRHDIVTMTARARVWHDIDPPPWNADCGAWRGGAVPARQGGLDWRVMLQRWFPVLASTAALVLAAGIHWRQPAATSAPTAAAAETPAAFSASPTAEQLLAVSRRERRQEMEALTALLKAEMDRRSLETEESLKYIIAHQIQSQRQLESMRGELQQTRSDTSEQL